VLCTKYGARRSRDEGPTAHRDGIRREIHDSLRRLRTDHVDVYYLHVPDPVTPWEETLRATAELVDEGKVRFAACSNVSAAHLRDAVAAAGGAGVTGFTVVQNEYNLLRRRAEHDTLPLCGARGLGFVAYFPLAGGLLTGKFSDVEAPAASTVARTSNRHRLTAGTMRLLTGLRAFAAESGRSMIEVAFAALLARPTVSCLLAGATDARQVRINASAARWAPSGREREVLDGWQRTWPAVAS
jgi:aryl-alcohol dehydrogenase-like predicted oxidoreductase